MEPLVSILIPAFNAQEWIAATLRSALGQTWRRREIVVVDDGSTDATLDIAQRFSSKEVLVLTQPNQGAAAARNKALSVCQGDYVQWLDADDLLAEDKIAKQLEQLPMCKSTRTLLSSSWGRFMHRPAAARFVPTALWSDLTPVEWLTRSMGENIFMPPATWLASRQLTQAAGPWDQNLCFDDDGEFFCRVLLLSDGVKFVPDARVFYRMSGAGAVSHIGKSRQKMDAHMRSMELHVGYVRSLDDSDSVRAACLRYLQSGLRTFYPERPDLVARARQCASQLGGELQVPPLSWKYSWIGMLLGRSTAKRVQTTVLEHKWSVIRFWDKTRSSIERLLERADARPRRPIRGPFAHGVNVTERSGIRSLLQRLSSVREKRAGAP